MTKVLQHTLPYDIRARRPLPGIAPLDMAEWIHIDEAYGDQMQLRGQLLAEKRELVLGMDPSAMPAAQELLALVLEQLPSRGFICEQTRVQRPDGEWVDLDWQDPMGTLGLLVQEDLCLLQKRGDEHVLTAAVLCFPSSWTLSQKLMKPLVAIHVPVEEYDENLARRVQRLFDGVRPGRPLWRFNVLWYGTYMLHYPRQEFDTRAYLGQPDAPYLRSERQCLVRLEKSDAVVFSIHTFMLDGDRGRKLMQADTAAGAALPAQG